MTALPKHLFAFIDLHFAEFVTGFGTPRGGYGVKLAAALLSRAAGSGNVCLDLARVAGRVLEDAAGEEPPPVCPPLAEWVAELRASPAVGLPGERRPLVLDERSRLYLYRYWDYEDALARDIIGRVRRPPPDLDRKALARSLTRHFPAKGATPSDGQKAAVAAAALNRFSVVTGGPGTGKTFTVARLLAVLAEQPHSERLRVRLAAPTGKAAARLRDTLAGTAVATPPAAGIPHWEVQTIHRLLRPLPDSPYFRHNRQNPLPVDLLVIDEASMVDLALMAKLLDALPADARLVLVGDRDQLASVEAGSVLGDICAGAGSPTRRTAGAGSGEAGGAGAGVLADCIVELRTSYRFAAASPIAELGRAVNEGAAARVMEILDNGTGAQVAWLDPEKDVDAPGLLERIVAEGYARCRQAAGPGDALAEHGRFKILCAHRVGPFGSDFVNRLAERILERRGVIRPGAGRGGSPWYAGRPVLITRNDYALELFNGDIGVALPGAAGEAPLSVFFPAAAGGTRRFAPYRLPEHETVFAMTVHKSQGSEFDHVMLVLPQKDSPVLTRELVYTALTRARGRITIWGSRRVLAAAVSRRVERASGLREALWGEAVGA